jgi:hypothetical protein
MTARASMVLLRTAVSVLLASVALTVKLTLMTASRIHAVVVVTAQMLSIASFAAAMMDFQVIYVTRRLIDVPLLCATMMVSALFHRRGRQLSVRVPLVTLENSVNSKSTSVH